MYFYHKDPPPEQQDNKILFIKKLAAVGVSMPRYISNYDIDTTERYSSIIKYKYSDTTNNITAYPKE